MPKLDAVFQPQQWVNNYAVDCAPAVRFDASESVFQLNLPQLQWVVSEVIRGGHDIDDVAILAGLAGEGAEHDGPFYVDIDREDMETFLKEIGVEDVGSLTREQWEAVVEAQKVSPAPSV